MLNDDTFLAKWLAGQLTPSEMQAFQQAEDYEKYARLVNAVDKLKAPEFDENAQLQLLRSRLHHSTSDESPALRVSSTRRITPLFWAAAAAVAALAVGTIMFWRTGAEPASDFLVYTTDVAENKHVTLPDGSEVTLNAMSEVSFNTKAWRSGHRMVQLKGEAFYSVKPGSTFTVVNDLGQIEVVGTRFDVRSRNNKLRVQCFEGKVRVKPARAAEKLLSAGQDLTIQSDGASDQQDPVQNNQALWLDGASDFKHTPLVEVLEEVERQFPVHIENKDDFGLKIYDGEFPHNNIDSALHVILKAFHLKYSREADKVRIIR